MSRPMDPFLSFIVKLSEHITEEELSTLKFLFEVPNGRAEKIRTSLDFLRYLIKERRSLNPENMDELKRGFEKVNRQDLIVMIDKYTQGRWMQEQPDILKNVQDCCEKNGINMRFSGGSFYRTNDISYLETNYGDKRKVEMTNLNGYGCKVTISCDGKIVITKKLNSKEELNFMFELHCEDLSGGQRAVGEGGSPFDLRQCLQAIVEPEAYDVYYRVRIVDNSSNVYFTPTKNIQVVKTSNAKIHAALEKMKEDCGVIGTCFFDGEKMWGPHELLSSAVKHHNKEHPLLLLQNPEEIVVKLAKEVARSGKVQLMQIKINPLQHTDHILAGIRGQIACGNSCEIKVDGKSLETNWMKCFFDHPIQVMKRDEYRDGLSSTRPTRSNLAFNAGSGSPFGADDELLGMIEHGYKAVASNELAPGQKQKEQTALKPGKVKTPEDEMITSPGDKVILTVYVVPPNAPPLL